MIALTKLVKKSWIMALAVNLLLVTQSFALNPGGGYYNTFQQGFEKIFQAVLVIAGVIFVILFLVGGIQYLTASGNEEASGKARKMIIDAVIGMIIILISWALGGWILRLLGAGDIGNTPGQ